MVSREDSRTRSSGGGKPTGIVVPGLQVREEIGSSVRGTVYAATDGRRSLAVKVFRRGIHVDRAALSRLEKLAPDRLRHPNLAPIEVLGELEDGTFYHVTPLLRGDSLECLIADLRSGASAQPSLSIFAVGADGAAHPQLAQRSAEVLAEALDGLALTHEAGITHQRLSPRNLILTPAGRLVITDFGGEASIDGGDDLVYRAPEQLDPYPQGIGPTADVYAVGVILYELLTRRLPFVAPSPRELKEQIEAGEFVPPRQHAPEIPASLEACILKAMAFDPRERYASAGEMATDLRRVAQGGEPVAVRALASAAESAQPSTARRALDWGVWLRVAAAALIIIGFVAWRWPNRSEKSLLLNPGPVQETTSSSASTTSNTLAPPPASTVAHPATVLRKDTVVRDLATGDVIAQTAALARLSLEISSGTRPRSDALIAAWVATAASPELQLRAIETLAIARESDPVLHVLGVGDDLPPVRLGQSTFHALSNLLLAAQDEPARRVLCAWDLLTCELLDASLSPAEHHVDPNLSVSLLDDPPRDFARRWIQIRAQLDPASLLAAAPHLAERADLVPDLVAGLTANASPEVRAALERIAREKPFTGGYCALSGLAKLGAHGELLDLARSLIPAGLRARAVELLGEIAPEFYVRELKTLALTSPEVEIRRSAFAVLESLDTSEALTAIPATVYDLDLKARALAWARRTKLNTTPDLYLELLEHNDPGARKLAVEILKAMEDVDLLEPLIARLLDVRKPTRDGAIDVLFARGDLTRIPAAVARHFGRLTRPQNPQAANPLANFTRAWSSLAEFSHRFEAQTSRVVARMWSSTGLAWLVAKSENLLRTRGAR